MKQKMDQVRVFITDFEAVYRKGIRCALSEIDTFEVVGEASTNMETLERISKTPADLLILNTNHNKPSGIDVTRYVSHKLPDVKVILMMDEYSTEHVVGAIKSGAKACVSKSIDLDSLLLTVSQVMHDELPISHFLLKPEVADYILKEYEVSNQNTNETDKSYIKLVQSEKMILNKIKDGTSLTNLATSFGISEEIVTDYLDEIAEKLVKIEYYNETLEQRYISNLISRNIGETTEEQKTKPDNPILKFHTVEVESHTPDNLPPLNGAGYDEKEREKTKLKKQYAEPGESVKDISGVIELARTAGRLSSIHEFNRYIMSITEGLMTEIDRRRRILRRIKKAINVELEFVKDSDITWI